jgi:hypothetical protein
MQCRQGKEEVQRSKKSLNEATEVKICVQLQYLPRFITENERESTKVEADGRSFLTMKKVCAAGRQGCARQRALSDPRPSQSTLSADKWKEMSVLAAYCTVACMRHQRSEFYTRGNKHSTPTSIKGNFLSPSPYLHENFTSLIMIIIWLMDYFNAFTRQSPGKLRKFTTTSKYYVLRPRLGPAANLVFFLSPSTQVLL